MENFKQIENYVYFGGVVAEHHGDIYDSLVEDDNETVREALPKELLTRFDTVEEDSEEEVYEYIASHVEPVYLMENKEK